MKGPPKKPRRFDKKTLKGDEPMYAITLTFEYLHSKTLIGQLKDTLPIVTEILHKSTIFQLWPEWRMTNGSIHYHGTICIVDKLKWLKATLPSLKRQGFIMIKKIDNMEKWITYCKKEQEVAEGVLKIPLSSKNISLPIIKRVVVEKHLTKVSNKLKDLAISSNIDEKESLQEAKTEINVESYKEIC